MKNLGVQLYTIREYMQTKEEIAESFSKLKGLGYTEIQTAGMTIEAEEFLNLAKKNDLKIIGTHSDYDRIINDTDKIIEEHKLFGTTNVGTGGMGASYRKSAETIKDYIKEVNNVAEKLSKHGMKFTYHNHSFEFKKYDGKRMFDMLIEGFDKDNVSFVFDTYWVQHGGGDIIDWMERLAGRIDILHLKDMGVNDEGPFYAEILEGNINFDKVMKTAKDIGVSHFVVEQDVCPGNPFDSLKLSAENIFRKY